MSKSETMPQDEPLEKEDDEGELENLVLEEEYIYEMDAGGGAPHLEREQGAGGDDEYSDAPPVCEVYETIDEGSLISTTLAWLTPFALERPCYL